MNFGPPDFEVRLLLRGARRGGCMSTAGFRPTGSMAAERQGEHGYPERNAEAVTSAALAWLSRLRKDRPFFLWVHYYDPHLTYAPPGDWRGVCL